MKRDLSELARKQYDVLVIGGGIYGVCAAWDAALRALSVALVEKGDFGHATSSNTLRIIHGGLRYLQHADIPRLRQSIHERSTFMRIAPHLVHPLPFLIPTYGHLTRGKEILSLAILMNDLIGFDRHRLKDPQKYLPPGRIISREECLRRVPGLAARGLTGGAIVYDCQMSSSERLVLSFARSATGAGADMANYVEVTGFLRNGDHVTGVTARDTLTGSELHIRARVVVNTTGPWSDRVLALVNGDRPHRRLVLSKAFNLLLNRDLVPHYALGVYGSRHFTDRDVILKKRPRLFFITPWQNRSLIGTVHLPYDGDPDDLNVTEDEIQAFLDEINGAYPAADLKRQDVTCSIPGLLPMAANSYTTNNVPLVRRYRVYDHQKEQGIAGLVSVMGVKFTEARHVAEKALDLVFRKLGNTPPKSTTAFTPLYGGQIEHFDPFLVQEMQRRSHGLTPAAIRALIYHYGSAYPQVLKYFDRNLTANHATSDTSRLMKAEVLYAIREEMAQTLTDVIYRRSTFGLARNLEDACLSTCAAIMSKELGWHEERTRREVQDLKQSTLR